MKSAEARPSCETPAVAPSQVKFVFSLSSLIIYSGRLFARSEYTLFIWDITDNYCLLNDVFDCYWMFLLYLFSGCVKTECSGAHCR